MENKNDVISRLHGRDPALLKELMDQYWIPLYSFGTGFYLNSGEVEEIVSDAFVIFWNRDPELFKSASHIKAFLYITVRNKALNQLKSQKRKAIGQNEYAGIMAYQHLGDEDQINTEYYSSILQPYLKKLSPTTKAVLELIKKGLTTQEIAEQLNISEKNVRTVKSKAIKDLRKMINDSKLNNDLLGLLILALIKLILLKL
jgi:RNA polymerase sigma factor (sigma-70 family)